AAQQYLFAHGADTDAVMGIECFPEPDNQIRYVQSLERTMAVGDFITASSYVFMNGMSGHDHVFMSVGAARPEAVDLVDAWAAGTRAFLAGMKPGARSDDLIAAAHSAIESGGYIYPGGSDVHPVGMEIPEGCGPSFLVDEGGKQMPPARRPYRLEAGMVVALQLHAGDKEGRAVEGGTSYVVTEDGYRQLGNVQVNQLSTATGRG
ncbi:MAG TPA: M24 family metallopeptidase, partial [Chloroflexota bacterium]